MVSRETLHGDLGAELADAVIKSGRDWYHSTPATSRRQGDEIKRAAVYEALQLPSEIDYSKVTALSFEVRQKLNQQRPTTLGQALPDLRCGPRSHFAPSGAF